MGEGERQIRVRDHKKEIPGHSIVGHLLRIPDFVDHSKPMSDADLGSQVAVIFAAGVDTTGHTIAWTL